MCMSSEIDNCVCVCNKIKIQCLPVEDQAAFGTVCHVLVVPILEGFGSLLGNARAWGPIFCSTLPQPSVVLPAKFY